MKVKIIAYLFLLISIGLVSCNSEKRIARLQAKYCDKIERSDTVVSLQIDTLIQERVLIKKLAPNPDTLMMFAQAYCDSANNAQMDVLHIEDKGHKAEISIEDNHLQAKIICNTDSLEQIIKEKDIIINNLKQEIINNEKLRYKTINPFYKYFFWSFLIVVFVSMGVLIWVRPIFKK